MAKRCIELRGVEVHNLKSVDLDIPHGELVVFCGRSGSGKTSLALDTLYAEGQRRYIESFSAYTRQFLEQLEKPAAERIDGIPPAIAVTHKNTSRSSRATIGTATEIIDYLRLLYCRIGELICPKCQQKIKRHSPHTICKSLETINDGLRLMVAFKLDFSTDKTPSNKPTDLLHQQLKAGFVRFLIDHRLVNLRQPSDIDQLSENLTESREIYVIVDRLTTGKQSTARLQESLETCFTHGNDTCTVFIEQHHQNSTAENSDSDDSLRFENYKIDDQEWLNIGFSQSLKCAACDIELPQPQPQLYSFNSPRGACPGCEGFGNIIAIDMDLVVPDPSKSIAEGAIAPWNSKAYTHELEELLALADDYNLPVNIPYSELSSENRELIQHGVPEREFGGLDGFFAWLERRKYKMHLRVFLSRWRTYYQCPDCLGQRLRPEALAAVIGGMQRKMNIAEFCEMKIRDTLAFIKQLELTTEQQNNSRMMIGQVQSRLSYLEQVGLGYLTLARTLRTLSGGESQRVALTSALGSSLVNMLYVLDEPSIGLHPEDVNRLAVAIRQLRERQNTVVVVEHEESMIRSADRVIELGPEAGERGGQITFQGTPDEMLRAENCLTGQYLSGRRGIGGGERRELTRGRVKLTGACGNNLDHLTVDFPLGILCLVTGVSGSGKSSLVQKTLYPALCRRMKKEAPKPLPYNDVFGDGQIDEVVLVDQSPIGRSARSNPVTYVKAFDQIRAVFAETLEAKTHQFTMSHFSFNVQGGRCSECSGDGYQQIDMQFLADVYRKCPRCQGKRYRKEILEVCYRGRNIAEVLEMTVREAFAFFRGQPKVQARLKRLIDVGLDYIRLGQPATTLSGGEAQRLKLAAYLSATSKNRSLLILDEPTTGLHFADIVQLLDCFDQLIDSGHSLIVVEHNLQVMRAADYMIDLGPGAADEGGKVIATGTPEEIATVEQSLTGKFLAAHFQ